MFSPYGAIYIAETYNAPVLGLYFNLVDEVVAPLLPLELATKTG
jgi:hypothetical protein